MPKLSGLDHLVLTVADIDRTVAFYEQVLGMRVEVFHPSDGSTRTALTFGTQKINLHAAANPFEPKAIAPQPGSADLCFLTEAPASDWLNHFESLDVDVIEGPVRRTGATGPIMSLYLRDPDGNLIEVSKVE